MSGAAGPTSDPATWVRVPPNTVMAAATALKEAAEQYRQSSSGDDALSDYADVCDGLSDRLTAHLARWIEALS
jgi:hypothetical protein